MLPSEPSSPAGILRLVALLKQVIRSCNPFSPS
jgi:hypothetical protein